MQSNIIRVSKPARYAVLSHEMLRDKRLSFAARGLLSYLLSLPDNWEVRVSHLIEQSPAGRDAVYSMLKELTTLGYMRRTEIRDAAGRIQGYETVVFETPENPTSAEEKPKEIEAASAERPDTAKPDTAEPVPANHPPKKYIKEEVTREEVTSESARAENPVSPSLSIFQEVYGVEPPIKFQEDIERTVTNHELWRRTIVRLKRNGTPAKNVGTMLEVYLEAEAKLLPKQDGLSSLILEGGLH